MAEKAKILIVDDEEVILETLKVILEGKGYSVNTARNGREALKILEEVSPDLILTDIVMPDMEGMEFISEVARKGRNIPIIVMSGNELGMRFLKSAKIFGARAALTKPFRVEELIELSANILGRDESGN